MRNLFCIRAKVAYVYEAQAKPNTSPKSGNLEIKWQRFVVDQDPPHRKFIEFTAYGENLLRELRYVFPGDNVEVVFEIVSHSSNGRVFNTLRVDNLRRELTPENIARSKQIDKDYTEEVTI